MIIHRRMYSIHIHYKWNIKHFSRVPKRYWALARISQVGCQIHINKLKGLSFIIWATKCRNFEFATQHGVIGVICKSPIETLVELVCENSKINSVETLALRARVPTSISTRVSITVFLKYINKFKNCTFLFFQNKCRLMSIFSLQFVSGWNEIIWPLKINFTVIAARA